MMPAFTLLHKTFSSTLDSAQQHNWFHCFDSEDAGALEELEGILKQVRLREMSVVTRGMRDEQACRHARTPAGRDHVEAGAEHVEERRYDHLYE
jgi:hypothetical protein